MKHFLAASLLLCSCATSRWTEASGPYTSAEAHCSLVLPEGWMRLRWGNGLMATRDGPALQRIYTGRNEFGKPLPAAKKTPRKDMLPEEAAEMLGDELASEGGVQGLSVVENVPATVAGRPGFRLTFRFRTADGLPMKGVVYGVTGDDALYGLGYVAAERYYFDLDLRTFEAVKESFRIIQS